MRTRLVGDGDGTNDGDELDCSRSPLVNEAAVISLISGILTLLGED